MTSPNSLIPTTILQLPEDPSPSSDTWMAYVHNGVTYKVQVSSVLNVSGVPTTRQVIAGTGLTGGGQLSSNITISVAPGGIGSTQLDSTGVTPGSYGGGSAIPVITVDTDGRVTAMTTVPITVGSGTVTSVNASGGSTGLNFTGGPITGSGTLTLSGTLGVGNGGTGTTSSTGTGNLVLSNSPILVTPELGTPSSGSLINCTGLPINVGTTGTLPVSRGGTGAITLTGYVKGSGTSALTASSTIPGSDISGDISGNAANVTGVVSVSNGGTGSTSLTGYVKGSGTGAMTASAFIPNTDITGLGTMSTQGSNAVSIVGGSINNTTIGGTTPAAGTFTSVVMTTGTITTAPTNGNDIVNKTYADSIAAGINFHQSCRLATTAALPSCVYNNGSSGVGATLTATANGALSVDTTLVASTNRILVKNQANAAENGVYTVTQTGSPSNPFILTRATDFDTPGTGVNRIDAGDFFLITAGSTLANTSWVQQTPLPITMGTTAIVFAQFGAPLTYSAGTGLNESPAYTFNIANTGVSAGNYGSATAVPVLSVNAQGQITSASSSSIAINGNQITSGFVGTGYGGTGLTTTPSNGQLLIGNGSGYTLSTLTAGAGINITNASGSITVTATGGGGGGMVYPNVGIAVSTGSAWDTSYSTTGTGSVVALSTSPTFTTPILGTPTSGTLTNCTGLPIGAGTTGTLGADRGGTGVSSLTQNNVILGNGTSAVQFVAPGTNGNVLTSNGTTWVSSPSSSGMIYPSSGIPNSTGTGWGTSYSTTGTGTTVALSNSPILVSPDIGVPSAGTLTNCTGLPISTGVSGLGTGVATALGQNVTGSGGIALTTSPSFTTPVLGTPTSGTLTNCTGLPISTGVSGLGTGVTTFLGTPSSANLASAVTDETGSGSLVFATSPTLVTPLLGTPTSGTLTNCTGLPLATGVTGTLPVANGGTGITAFGTGVATALGQNVSGSGSIALTTSPSFTTPVLGTPTSGTLTNCTGLPVSTGISGLGSGIATFLATPSSSNLAAAVTDETGSGSLVFATSPTLVTPLLGTPTSGTLTNCTGLPVATGISGLGTGVATALAVNTGTAGAFVVNGGALGTPTSGTLTNATGLPLSSGVTGTLPVANGGTGITAFGTGVATALGQNVSGSGSIALTTSPSFTTPVLGTPTSGTLTNCSGLPLSTGVTGTLPVGNGGTGVTGTPTNGQLLIGNGSGYSLATLTAGTNVTITNSAGGITIASTGGGGSMVYPAAGIAVSTGSAWGTSLTAPAGSIVGTTDTQTLSNKTLTGTQETVFTITDAAAFEVNPANGGIQQVTLGANRTPKATSFAAGQSVTLLIDDGTAFTITWTDSTWGTGGVTWVGGVAPTLATSGYTVIEFWKVGTKVYGALVGTVA